MFSRIEADLEASVEGPSGMGGPARESFDSPPVRPFHSALHVSGFTRSCVCSVFWPRKRRTQIKRLKSEENI